LFVTCGRLSWLPVSFLLHVKHTLSYRIVSNTNCHLPSVTTGRRVLFSGAIDVGPSVVLCPFVRESVAKMVRYTSS